MDGGLSGDGTTTGTSDTLVHEGIVRPIAGEDEAGTDPRLNETFEAIEFELAKIGGVEQLQVDWVKVEQLSTELLLTTSKDLRCAGHWAAARLNRAGADGLREGMATLAALVSRYRGQLFPRRNKGRVSAVEWLSEQVEVELARGKCQMTRAEYDQVEQDVDRIGDVFEELELESPHLHAIRESLAHIKIVASDEEREEEVLRAFPEGYGELGVAVLERCAVQTADKESPLTLRMRRWALWMASPGGGNNRDTTIAQDARAALDSLCSGHRWVELLERSERLFLANPFWIDLSYWSARAARHVVGDEGRLAIVGELRALLTRDPNLVEAVDRDGGELASGEVRAWIEQEVLVHGGGGGGNNDATVALPQEVEHLLEQGKLREAMINSQAWINVSMGRVRFARCVALANAFKRIGATEQSFLVFRGLHGHLRSMTVKEWEPGLFAACLEGYLSSKKVATGLGPEDESLLEELSVLDPTAVLGVLPA